MNGGLLHHGVGAQLKFAALGVLGAHIHQPYPGRCHLHDLLHIDAAHDAKMGQGFRLAVQIGAGIHQQIAATGCGNDGGKTGTLDALDPFDDEVGAHHNGTGAAG